jgi:exodeoxyribonuclease VII small subunit
VSTKSTSSEGASTKKGGAAAAADEGLGFSAAMEELEAILRRIEGEEVDIDRLAEELRRATELLEICRGKIRRAEVEVTQIVQALEQDDDETADEGEDADEDEDDDELDEDDIPF